MKETLVDLDGELCIAWTDDYEVKGVPSRVTNYWPTGARTAPFCNVYGYTLPAAVRSLTSGRYELIPQVQPFYGNRLIVQLIDGGTTKAIKHTIEPIPCPKVRAGIETRWRDGYWQKHLRSKGWVAA